MQTFELGRFAGLRFSTTSSALVASLVFWGTLTAVAFWLLKLSLTAAIMGGLMAVALHWFSEIAHQLGHAWAARRVGYPMQGIRLWFLLGTSIYPRDEGDLPAAVHIRRALGGAPVSLLLTLVGGLLILLGSATPGLFYYLVRFFFLENLFVFTLGAFLPLGFTDGSTLLEWWPKR